MWIRKSIHFIWTALVLGGFFLRSAVIRMISRDPVKRRLLAVKNTTITSRRFLKTFKIRLKVKNPELLDRFRGENYMVVGNHASYLDIFLLASQENYVFISSVQMNETPVLGSITRAGGCLFTDRKRKATLPQEIRRFAETVRQGFKVVLFPEEPGCDGSEVKSFRKSLFQVAVDACCAVVPVCIRYLRLDGKPVNHENRKIVCWFEGIQFVRHLWELMARRLEAEICFLDPVLYDPELKRGEISDLVHARVSETFNSYDAQTS